jgi:hypothetical protein
MGAASLQIKLIVSRHVPKAAVSTAGSIIDNGFELYHTLQG